MESLGTHKNYYFFTKVDFGSTKVSNAAGQIATIPSTKINEQEFKDL